MKIREILAKSILSKSRIYDYAVNPYVGCGHACRYCYAAFMKRDLFGTWKSCPGSA